MKFFIIRLMSFLRGFVKGDGNKYSTKRFAFMAQGPHYVLLNAVSLHHFMSKTDGAGDEHIMDILYLNAGLLVVFAGFVTTELLAKVIMNLKEKNNK